MHRYAIRRCKGGAARAEAGRGGCAGPRERVLPEQRRCRARPGRRVAHRPRGARATRWPASRTTCPIRARPWWPASRRIRIGITCSGTPSSARRPVTARPAARPPSGIGCPTPDCEGPHRRRLIPPDIAEQVPLDLLGLITGLPAETAQIPWDGPQVRIIEHQAHAPGHAALLIEERGVLVAGDMLSDVLIPMLDLNGTATRSRTTSPRCGCSRAWRATSMSSSPATGPSAELIRYARGSTRIGRTCSPCATARFPATRGSAPRPRPAGNGWRRARTATPAPRREKREELTMSVAGHQTLRVLDGAYVLERPADLTEVVPRAGVLAVVFGPDGSSDAARRHRRGRVVGAVER